MPYFIDYWYIVLVLPAIAFAMITQAMVHGRYAKYSKVFPRAGVTGAQAAELILRKNDVTGVRIEPTRGKLTDHYDPRTNTIRLSEQVYGSTSIAAVGIAAHEAGHAVQRAKNYAPMRLRTAIVPATQAGSWLSMILIMLGLFINMTGLALLGVALFGLTTFFQLVTLPVEFNASKRALAGLRWGDCLNSEETAQARKVLSAAALTYVAALAVSVMQLLRLLLIVNNRRS